MIAGSDAHTLRRIGLTWTEAPGRTREEFMASLRQGLGRPGGRHGTAAAVAGDAYGVIAPVPRRARGSSVRGITGLAARRLPGVRRRVAAGAVPAAGDRHGKGKAREAPRGRARATAAPRAGSRRGAGRLARWRRAS